MLIWGLCVIYRTLGRGVFFCRRCGGDREYRHREYRREAGGGGEAERRGTDHGRRPRNGWEIGQVPAV